MPAFVSLRLHYGCNVAVTSRSHLRAFPEPQQPFLPSSFRQVLCHSDDKGDDDHTSLLLFSFICGWTGKLSMVYTDTGHNTGDFTALSVREGSWCPWWLLHRRSASWTSWRMSAWLVNTHQLGARVIGKWARVWRVWNYSYPAAICVTHWFVHSFIHQVLGALTSAKHTNTPALRGLYSREGGSKTNKK